MTALPTVEPEPARLPALTVSSCRRPSRPPSRRRREASPETPSVCSSRCRGDGSLVHGTFSELPSFLEEGDLVVINTSGTLAAEVPGTDHNGRSVDVHLSTQLPAGLWTVELREGERPLLGAAAGESLELPARRTGPPSRPVRDATPAASGCGWRRSRPPNRCTPTLRCMGAPSPTATSAAAGRSALTRTSTSPSPVRPRCRAPGRPFTAEILTRLVTRGIGVAPLLLHTGVASLEATEAPYPEYFRVAAEHRQPDQRHPPGRRSGRRGRDHGGAGAGDGGRLAKGSSTPAAAGPTSSSRRSGSSAPSTACSPAGTSRRPHTWPCWRRLPAGELLERSYAAALEGATCGTSSATSIWFCRDRGARAGVGGPTCRRWRRRGGRSS